MTKQATRKTRRWSRGHRLNLLTLVFTAVGTAIAAIGVVSAWPDSTSESHTPPVTFRVVAGEPCNAHNAAPLNAAPLTGSATLLCIPEDTPIEVDCKMTGSTVVSPLDGQTYMEWDHTSYEGQTGFVADAFVRSGPAGAPVRTCSLESGTGIVMADGCLNLHRLPGDGAPALDCIPVGTTITIDCTAAGPTVTLPAATSSIWNHTTYNGVAGYVSDAGVFTNSASAVAPACV